MMMSSCALRPASANTVQIDGVGVARSFFSRFIGLMGRETMGNFEALVLERCSSVHTVGMRFPLDIVFLNKHRRVIKLKRNVAPLRFALALGAKHTIELPVGGIDKYAIALGDEWAWGA